MRDAKIQTLVRAPCAGAPRNLAYSVPPARLEFALPPPVSFFTNTIYPPSTTRLLPVK